MTACRSSQSSRGMSALRASRLSCSGVNASVDSIVRAGGDGNGVDGREGLRVQHRLKKHQAVEGGHRIRVWGGRGSQLAYIALCEQHVVRDRTASHTCSCVRLNSESAWAASERTAAGCRPPPAAGTSAMSTSGAQGGQS